MNYVIKNFSLFFSSIYTENQDGRSATPSSNPFHGQSGVFSLLATPALSPARFGMDQNTPTQVQTPGDADDADHDSLDDEERAMVEQAQELLRVRNRLQNLLKEASETEKRRKVLIKDTHNAAVRVKLAETYGGEDKIPLKKWLQFWSSRADKLAQVEVDNLMSVLRQSGIADDEKLPVEGRSLLRVSQKMANEAGVKFPEVRYLDSAKGYYSFYGLENGLLGKSIGNYHHDLAAFLEIVAAERPTMFGLYATGAVSKPSNISILGRFWKICRQDDDDEDAECFRCFKCTEDGTPIPHFFFHFFNDGVQVFQNSVKKSMVVMMGRVHSISPCFHHSKDDSLRILTPNLYPFLISIFHGYKGGEPLDVTEWMQDFIAELMKLDGRLSQEVGLQKAIMHQPDKQSPVTGTQERKITASIHYVIADGPARQQTKQCKGVMGYCHCEWCTQHGTKGIVLRRKHLQQEEELRRQQEEDGDALERGQRGEKRPLPDQQQELDGQQQKRQRTIANRPQAAGRPQNVSAGLAGRRVIRRALKMSAMLHQQRQSAPDDDDSTTDGGQVPAKSSASAQTAYLQTRRQRGELMNNRGSCLFCA
jgi:hypothetical protein